jgi:hypothetical protein
MDERKLTKAPGFAPLKADLDTMMASLVAALGYHETRIAAE